MKGRLAGVALLSLIRRRAAGSPQVIACIDPIALESLPEKLWQSPTRGSDKAVAAPPPGPNGLSLKRAVRELEESYIKAALRRTRGNRTRAAELLEISHRALLYKIKEFGIDPDAESEQGDA